MLVLAVLAVCQAWAFRRSVRQAIFLSFIFHILSSRCPGPASVTGVQNLKVVATITNTGDEMLEILNDSRGLLSKRPVNKFTITSSHGGRDQGEVFADGCSLGR
jgi:hypothetical protein